MTTATPKPDSDSLPQLKAVLESIDSALSLAAYGRKDGKHAFAKGLHEGMARDLLELASVARALPDGIKQQCPGIPWAKLAGVHSRMLYDRYRLNPDRLWLTAEAELPVIKAEIEALVAGLGRTDLEDSSA